MLPGINAQVEIMIVIQSLSFAPAMMRLAGGHNCTCVDRFEGDGTACIEV